MSIPKEMRGTPNEPVFYSPLMLNHRYNYFQRSASHYHDALTGRCEKVRGGEKCSIRLGAYPPDPTPEDITEFEFIRSLVWLDPEGRQHLYGMDLRYVRADIHLRWVVKALIFENNAYRFAPVFYRLTPCCIQAYHNPFMSSSAVCVGCGRVMRDFPLQTGMEVGKGVAAMECWVDFDQLPLEAAFYRHALEVDLELFKA